MRSLSLFCLLLMVCGRSGETTPTNEPTEAPPSKVLLRERTVYVPYEKLKETFEKEGRGVFLPYEEFLKLWNAGQPREKPPEEVKPPTDAVISGGSYVGVAHENAVRFEVTYKVRALGKNWSELALPLRNVAIETATLSDPLAVFAPKGDGYTLVLPKPGEYTLTLAFSVRIESKPGQRRIEFGIPATAVSRLELTIPEKDLRVEVTPKMAATTSTPDQNSTKVQAFVGNANSVSVTWMPPAGKVEKGKAIIIASQAAAVKLGERIVRMDTAINYRIESNEEDVFRVKLPPEMRLLSVKGNNIRKWSEENAELKVELHTPVKDAFALLLRFERILEKMPEKLDIAFPQAIDALREDGFVSVSHDTGLRLRVESSTGLSQIDAKDLPEILRGGNLLAGFRYVAHPLALSLKIETILPQIQSSTTSVASVGIEEDTLSGWIDYTISKAGVFTLKLRFAARWDVVSVGDPQSIEDFATAVDGADKVLTVNLKNKAMGQFRLPFKLTSPGRAVPGEITLETVRVVDTQQDAGLFGVSAPKAFKLTTGERIKMTAANVQALVKSGLLAQLPQDFDLPLAFTYTAQPAAVKITIERRQTEIRVTGAHTIIVSEPALEMRHRLEYFIQYAGTDKLAFSVPSTLDDKLVDVKCAGMKEKKKVGEANGRTKWEVSLQEKTLGAVVIDVVYKESFKTLEYDKPQDIAIADIRAEDVNSQSGYIVVRKESALEIQPKAANLERVDPVKLPPELRATSEAGNVYLAYRYVQAERSLILTLTRHIAIDVSSIVVDLMRATFVLSAQKGLTTNLDLYVENERGEQYLGLALPKNATVRPLAGGIGASPLRSEKDGLTLYKLPSSAEPFWVRVIYSTPLDTGSALGLFGSAEITTPEVFAAGGSPAPKPVPVNKIEAELFVPEEYVYFDFGGTFHARPQGERVSNTLTWIENTLRMPDQRPVVRGDMRLPPPPGNESFPTMGKQFRLQTLAPRGTATFNYCERKLFALLDVLLFMGVFAAGWLLIRKTKTAPAGSVRPVYRSPLWVPAIIIFIALCWSWLAVSDFGELPRSACAAGIALAMVVAGIRIARAAKYWREDRIARAPDPFLENAVQPATAGPGPSPAPTDATPPKKQDKGDDSAANEKKKKNGGGK